MAHLWTGARLAPHKNYVRQLCSYCFFTKSKIMCVGSLPIAIYFSMEQRPSWENNRFSASLEIPGILGNSEGWLPQSQKPATCSYPEPNWFISSPPPLTSLRSVLILSCHLLLSLPSGFYRRKSSAPRLLWLVRNMVKFLRWGVNTWSKQKLENHPLSAVCDWLFNTFAGTLHIRKPFFHSQPEDAPCSDDRDSLFTLIWSSIKIFTEFRYVIQDSFTRTVWDSSLSDYVLQESRLK